MDPQVLATLTKFVPSVASALGLLVVVWAARRLLSGDESLRRSRAFMRQVVLTTIWTVGIITILLALPISDSTRGQLLSLLGILVSAAIALSSTVLIGNTLAGLIMRGQGSIKVGDFIEVDDHFGRVTELGLVQSEIQTEARNLTTFPNSYLVQNAVTVYRDSGTIVAAEVSLGYDVPQRKIKRSLIRAAEGCSLEDVFVQVLELGDFSVLYRVAGLLKDTRRLVSTRSALRSAMLDELHADGVEIVSPTFMNQRRIGDAPIIARREWGPSKSGEGRLPEELMFDKADEAETLEKLREVYEEFGQRIGEVEEALAASETGSEEHGSLLKRREKLQVRRRRLQERIEAKGSGA